MDSRDANERLDELYAKIIGQYTSEKTISERLTELEKSVAELKNGKADKKEEPPWWKQPSTRTGMWANGSLQMVRGAVQGVDASVSGVNIAASAIAISMGGLSLTGFAKEIPFWGSKSETGGTENKFEALKIETISNTVESNLSQKNNNVTEIDNTLSISQSSSVNKEGAVMEIH